MDLYKLLSGSPCMALRSFWTTDWAATYECDPTRVVVDALGGDKSHAAPPSRAVSMPCTDLAQTPRTIAPPEMLAGLLLDVANDWSVLMKRNYSLQNMYDMTGVESSL